MRHDSASTGLGRYDFDVPMKEPSAVLRSRGCQRQGAPIPIAGPIEFRPDRTKPSRCRSALRATRVGRNSYRPRFNHSHHATYVRLLTEAPFFAFLSHARYERL